MRFHRSAVVALLALAVSGCPKEKTAEAVPETQAPARVAPSPPVRTLAPERLAALPATAQAKLKAIHAAAVRRDFKALRAQMDQGFTWSFGGDPDADQAIEAWRADGESVDRLVRTLEEGQCTRSEDGPYVTCEHVQAPAGQLVLRSHQDAWLWEAFAAGD